MTEIDAQATAKTEARYDRIAPIYNLMELLMELSAKRWRRLLWSQIGRGKTLEVGVGTGKNMPYYPPHAEMTAIDLSDRMLQRARRRAKREGMEVDLQQMDAQSLEFADGSFDTAAASFVFCSVPDPVLGLQELKRVVNPQGKILLLEHLRPEKPWLGKLFDLLNPVTVRLFGFNINRRTLDNIGKAGLHIEDVRDLDRSGIVKLVVAKPHLDDKNSKDGKEVTRMAEKVKDPVCKMEIDKDKAAATYEYKGETYYFCAPGCKQEFERAPEKYLK